MIADVKLALQKDGFILCSASVHQCVCQPIQMLTFCIKVLHEVFSFACIFESFLSRLLMFD